MATSRKQASAVWEYFEEPVIITERKRDGKQVKKVACKLCDQLLADSGGTTNLTNHLQAKHSEQYKQLSDSSSSKQTTLT